MNSILSFIIFLEYLKSLAVSERVSLDVSYPLFWCVKFCTLLLCFVILTLQLLRLIQAGLSPVAAFLSF